MESAELLDLCLGWIMVRHDDGVVPGDELEELVDISYTAVVAKVPKRLRPETWSPACQGTR